MQVATARSKTQDIASGIAGSIAALRVSLHSLNNNVEDLRGATFSHRVALLNVAEAVKVLKELKVKTDQVDALRNVKMDSVSSTDLMNYIDQLLDSKEYLIGKYSSTETGVKYVQDINQLLDSILTTLEARVFAGVKKVVVKVCDFDTLQKTMASGGPILFTEQYLSVAESFAPLVKKLNQLEQHNVLTDTAQLLGDLVVSFLDVSSKFTGKVEQQPLLEKTYTKGSHIMLFVFEVLRALLSNVHELCVTLFFRPCGLNAVSMEVYEHVFRKSIQMCVKYTKVTLARYMPFVPQERVFLTLDLIHTLHNSIKKSPELFEADETCMEDLKSIITKYGLCALDECVHLVKSNTVPISPDASIHEVTTTTMHFARVLVGTSGAAFRELMSQDRSGSHPDTEYIGFLLNALFDNLKHKIENTKHVRKDALHVFLCNNIQFAYSVLCDSAFSNVRVWGVKQQYVKGVLDKAVGYYLESSWMQAAHALDADGISTDPSDELHGERVTIKTKLTKFFDIVEECIAAQKLLKVADRTFAEYLRQLAVKTIVPKYDQFCVHFVQRCGFKHPEKYMKCQGVELSARIQGIFLGA
eukprot:PhF_6_TR35385/c0_g1_i1/m.51437/K07195/EXOC7, EXO70; exocyst complex component 7